ncbi:MAG: hypothetical protein ACI3VE_05705 [Oscillospiraceae bacterium]
MTAFIIAPFVATVIGIIIIVSAKKEYFLNDINPREIDDNTARQRLILCASFVGSSAVYGIVCFLMASMQQVNDMTPAFWISDVLISLGAVLSGVLIAKGIKSGAVFSLNDFSKTVVSGCMGNVVSVAGLMVFVLSFKGMM